MFAKEYAVSKQRCIDYIEKWPFMVIFSIYYLYDNELPIFLCERKPGNRSPVNYFISSNGLFSRAN